MNEMIDIMFESYPWLKAIVFWIVALRVVNKCLFSILGKYVQFTEDTRDDEKFNKLISNKYYRAISFLLDLFASVKLPQVKRTK